MLPLLPIEFEQLLNALPDAVLLVRKDGRIVYASAQVEALLGYPPHSLVGTNVDALVPESDRPQHAARRHAYHAAPTTRAMSTSPTLRAQRRDGTTFPADISLSAIDVDGEQLALACLRDVTQRAGLLEQLRATEAHFRLLVENASEVFYRVTFADDPMRGTVEYVSPQCERLTGLRPEQFVTDPGRWTELVHPDDRHALLDTTLAILKNRREGTRYYRLRNVETGDYSWLADRIVTIENETGRVVGYQGAARDITERVRADRERDQLESQLRHAHKMETLGQMAGGIAHDFNNILTVILNSCELALAEPDAPGAVRQYLDDALLGARRAATLTQQLLAFSRRQVVAPSVQDLSVHLAGMEAMLRRTIPSNIEVTFRLADRLWPVRIDPSQVDQVVLNLAVNSRDAMPEGGTLIIATSNASLRAADCAGRPGLTPGEYVALTMTDVGHGMSHDTLEHAFEPFFTTKPEGRGTGLGLASVYGIVKQNHGYVDVTSELGRGTTVTVYLPRAEGEAARPKRVPGDELVGGSETILVVDDTADVRRVTHRMLKQLGYRVLEASDVNDALALCAAHREDIDLLLTDIVMPVMNGIELARRAQAEVPRLRTLYMSGYARSELGADSLGRAGAAHLQKPFTAAALAQAVRSILDGT